MRERVVMARVRGRRDDGALMWLAPSFLFLSLSHEKAWALSWRQTRSTGDTDRSLDARCANCRVEGPPENPKGFVSSSQRMPSLAVRAPFCTKGVRTFSLDFLPPCVVSALKEQSGNNTDTAHFTLC